MNSALYIDTSTIAHYKASVSIMTYLLTPSMLCVFILFTSDRKYSLKLTLNNRFVKSIHGNFIFIVFARNLMRKPGRKKLFSYFVLLEVLWALHQGFMSNEITHSPLQFYTSSTTLDILWKNESWYYLCFVLSTKWKESRNVEQKIH